MDDPQLLDTSSAYYSAEELDAAQSFDISLTTLRRCVTDLLQTLLVPRTQAEVVATVGMATLLVLSCAVVWRLYLQEKLLARTLADPKATAAANRRAQRRGVVHLGVGRVCDTTVCQGQPPAIGPESNTSFDAARQRPGHRLESPTLPISPIAIRGAAPAASALRRRGTNPKAASVAWADDVAATALEALDISAARSVQPPELPTSGLPQSFGMPPPPMPEFAVVPFGASTTDCGAAPTTKASMIASSKPHPTALRRSQRSGSGNVRTAGKRPTTRRSPSQETVGIVTGSRHRRSPPPTSVCPKVELQQAGKKLPSGAALATSALHTSAIAPSAALSSAVVPGSAEKRARRVALGSDIAADGNAQTRPQQPLSAQEAMDRLLKPLSSATRTLALRSGAGQLAPAKHEESRLQPSIAPTAGAPPVARTRSWMAQDESETADQEVHNDAAWAATLGCKAPPRRSHRHELRALAGIASPLPEEANASVSGLGTAAAAALQRASNHSAGFGLFSGPGSEAHRPSSRVARAGGSLSGLDLAGLDQPLPRPTAKALPPSSFGGGKSKTTHASTHGLASNHPVEAFTPKASFITKPSSRPSAVPAAPNESAFRPKTVAPSPSFKDIEKPAAMAPSGQQTQPTTPSKQLPMTPPPVPSSPAPAPVNPAAKTETPGAAPRTPSLAPSAVSMIAGAFRSPAASGTAAEPAQRPKSVTWGSDTVVSPPRVTTPSTQAKSPKAPVTAPPPIVFNSSGTPAAPAPAPPPSAEPAALPPVLVTASAPTVARDDEDDGTTTTELQRVGPATAPAGGKGPFSSVAPPVPEQGKRPDRFGGMKGRHLDGSSRYGVEAPSAQTTSALRAAFQTSAASSVATSLPAATGPQAFAVAAAAAPTLTPTTSKVFGGAKAEGSFVRPASGAPSLNAETPGKQPSNSAFGGSAFSGSSPWGAPSSSGPSSSSRMRAVAPSSSSGRGRERSSSGGPQSRGSSGGPQSRGSSGGPPGRSHGNGSGRGRSSSGRGGRPR